MSIKTGKVVTRHESTLYIQQEYVNWEFLADPYHKTIFYNPTSDFKVHNVKWLYFEVNEKHGLFLDVDQFYTEDSYKRNRLVVSVVASYAEGYHPKANHQKLEGFHCLDAQKQIQDNTTRILYPNGEKYERRYELTEYNALDENDVFVFHIKTLNRNTPLQEHIELRSTVARDSKPKYKTEFKIPTFTQYQNENKKFFFLQQVSNSQQYLLGQKYTNFTIPANNLQSQVNQKFFWNITKHYGVIILPGNPIQQSFTVSYPVSGATFQINRKFGLFFVSKTDV